MKNKKPGPSTKDAQLKKLYQLILCNPVDVKLLKQEYYTLSGKRFKRRNEK